MVKKKYKLHLIIVLVLHDHKRQYRYQKIRLLVLSKRLLMKNLNLNFDRVCVSSGKDKFFVPFGILRVILSFRLLRVILKGQTCYFTVYRRIRALYRFEHENEGIVNLNQKRLRILNTFALILTFECNFSIRIDCAKLQNIFEVRCFLHQYFACWSKYLI